MNLDYRTRQNINHQAAQQFAKSAQKLASVMPGGVISAQFDTVSGVIESKVHLSSIADVRLFCNCPKLTEREYDYRHYEYGGISNGIHYFCLIEPKIANELGLKLEEED